MFCLPYGMAFILLGKNKMTSLLIIFFVALILRLLHIVGQETRNDFFSNFWLVDSSPYLHYAHKLLAGEPFLTWQPPLLSYVLAFFSIQLTEVTLEGNYYWQYLVPLLA